MRPELYCLLEVESFQLECTVNIFMADGMRIAWKFFGTQEREKLIRSGLSTVFTSSTVPRDPISIVVIRSLVLSFASCCTET